MHVRSNLMLITAIAATALWGCGDEEDPAPVAPAEDVSVQGDGAVEGDAATDTTTAVTNPWAAPEETDPLVLRMREQVALLRARAQPQPHP